MPFFAEGPRPGSIVFATSASARQGTTMVQLSALSDLFFAVRSRCRVQLITCVETEITPTRGRAARFSDGAVLVEVRNAGVSADLRDAVLRSEDFTPLEAWLPVSDYDAEIERALGLSEPPTGPENGIVSMPWFGAASLPVSLAGEPHTYRPPTDAEFEAIGLLFSVSVTTANVRIEHHMALEPWGIHDISEPNAAHFRVGREVNRLFFALRSGAIRAADEAQRKSQHAPRPGTPKRRVITDLD